MHLRMYFFVAGGMNTDSSLLSREARADWESDFNTTYMQQLLAVSLLFHINIMSFAQVLLSSFELTRSIDIYHLQQLDKQFEQATTLILNDSSEG